MKRRWRIATWLAVFVAAYVSTASIVFAFRHPDMTDTQRLLCLWDAMCWRQL